MYFVNIRFRNKLCACANPAVLMQPGKHFRRHAVTLLVYVFRCNPAGKVFVAPKLIGGGVDAPGPIAGCGIDFMNEALALKQISVEQIDDDLLIEGLTNYDN